MARRQWVVHPNRFAIDSDEPGHNGHYRVVQPAQRPPTAERNRESTCIAAVTLPKYLAHLANTPSGVATFGGYDWWFPVGAARAFFIRHIDDAAPPPPFGFRRDKRYWWWDTTETPHSLIDDPDIAGEHVHRYLSHLFPDSPAIELTDLRDHRQHSDLHRTCSW